MRQSATVILLTCGFLVVLAAAGSAPAADPPVAWLSPDAVRRQLEQPISINWSGVPLRHALQNLSRSQRVAMLLDRRVDPDQEVELALTDVSLETALAGIASKLKLAVSRIGPAVYLGPPATAERLRTLVELRKQELSQLPQPIRSALLAQKRCKWEMLATPRDLLAETARDYKVQIEALADVPHDLWPAAELPPIGLAERVSLIAAQFDLTFDVTDGGRTLRLVPIPDQVVLEKTYAHSNPSLALDRLKSLLKRSQLEAGDKKLIVRGPAEEHELVESFLAGKSTRQTTVTPGRKVYQLDIVMPVGRLIKQLEPKLELNIELDSQAIERAGLSLDKEVKVSVRNVSEDQLLTAVLEPAGLTFQRDGKTLIVQPKDVTKAKDRIRTTTPKD